MTPLQFALGVGLALDLSLLGSLHPIGFPLGWGYLVFASIMLAGQSWVEAGKDGTR